MVTMNAFNSFLILLTAFVAVFVQSALGGVLGVQLDLLPALMVYASLTAGIPTVAALALFGGLWFDSLSANPLGISVLPLVLIGYLVSLRNELILRDQKFAQFVIGLVASFTAPTLSLVMMLTSGKDLLVGWGTLWQLALMTLVGGIMTPLLFKFFGTLANTFNYQEASSPSFRPDREIRRGRN
jgi:rod shape-determining protein MreD